jgi:hypothetical protein
LLDGTGGEEPPVVEEVAGTGKRGVLSRIAAERVAPQLDDPEGDEVVDGSTVEVFRVAALVRWLIGSDGDGVMILGILLGVGRCGRTGIERASMFGF